MSNNFIKDGIETAKEAAVNFKEGFLFFMSLFLPFIFAANKIADEIIPEEKKQYKDFEPLEQNDSNNLDNLHAASSDIGAEEQKSDICR